MDPGERNYPVFHRFSVLRGVKVFDRNGEEFGRLEDIFIHEGERRMHYLDVRGGGFVGLGRSIFLIPVEWVETIREDRVTVTETREKVASSPETAPGRVLGTHDRRAVSRSFGGPGGYAGG